MLLIPYSAAHPPQRRNPPDLNETGRVLLSKNVYATQHARSCNNGRNAGLLAELTTLHAGTAKHLAVLLLRHALATLLNDGTHRLDLAIR